MSNCFESIGNSNFTVPIDQSGAVPVNIMDQTTPPIDLYFLNSTSAPTTVYALAVVDSSEIELTSAANFVIGDAIAIFESELETNRFYVGEVISKNGNVVTVDSPLDYPFTVGSTAVSAMRNMNVDGSGEPVIFSVKGGGTGSTLVINIARIMISMTTDGIIDLSKFGDIAGGLTNGIVLRKTDGDKRNIWNVKTNRDFANIAYDLNIYAASNPSQGENGLACRYSLAGQEKHGVAIRLEPNEQLDIVIQDNLSSLLEFSIMAQGHIVND